MEFIDIRVYEHAAVPRGEVLLVQQADSGAVPPDLREKIKVPCILTCNAARLGENLTLMDIAEMFEASGRGPSTPRAGTAGGDNRA